LDSACQGLYSGEKYTKIKPKTRIQFECLKILKNMHILVLNQNLEKQKKGNSKIPKPKFLLSCEQNMLRKVVMEINGLSAQSIHQLLKNGTIYGAKFIQLKICTVFFYTGQNLYSSKFIQYKIYTGEKSHHQLRIYWPNPLDTLPYFRLLCGQKAAVRPSFFTYNPNFWPCGLSAVQSLKNSVPPQKNTM
jgi:hypothetical protein